MTAQRESHPIDALAPVADVAQLAAAQDAVSRVFIHDSLVRYVQRLTAETRRHPHAAWGASPRGALGLMRMAQSVAALRGERFVTPDHVKRLAEAVLAHRIVVKPRSRVQGMDGVRIVAESVERVEVPIDYGPA